MFNIQPISFTFIAGEGLYNSHLAAGTPLGPGALCLPVMSDEMGPAPQTQAQALGPGVSLTPPPSPALQ